MRFHITVNKLPGSSHGVVAYDWTSGKISVSDGRYLKNNVISAVHGLKDKDGSYSHGFSLFKKVNSY